MLAAASIRIAIAGIETRLLEIAIKMSLWPVVTPWKKTEKLFGTVVIIQSVGNR